MKPRTTLPALAPVVTGLALALHPADPVRAADLQPVLTRWLAVHLVLLIGLPIIAWLMLRMLRGMRSTAATVARISVVVTTAFYAAFESLVGIGTGVLVGMANDLSPRLREGASSLAQRWWEVPLPVAVISTVAIVSWVLALASASVAAGRAGASRTVTWGLLAAAILFTLGHPGVTGLAAMTALAVSLVADEQRRRGDGSRRTSAEVAG